MLKAILSALDHGGVKHKTEKRGLDHGVWGTLHQTAKLMIVPFLVAFGGKTEFPVIQVSLPGNGSPESTAELGRALAPLRYVPSDSCRAVS
jgi:4,5-DOPA dioxygenase extradiol